MMKLLSVVFILLTTTAAAQIRVGSEKAHFDGTRLVLSGEVVIEDLMGKLTAERAELVRNESDAKLPFTQLKLLGSVHIQFKNGAVVECEEVYGDLVEKCFTFSGSGGLCYFDERGKVWAQRGSLCYEELEERIELASIHLYEDIKMVRGSQCILADQVDWGVDQKRFIFSGLNKKVLFIDESKGMQIAAAQVVVDERGEQIRGVGQVEFTLSEDEMKRFHERFVWDQKSS